MVHETTKFGRVAMKPTQAQEDGINSGLLSWLLRDTKFTIGRKYAVDGYEEHKDRVDRIISLLPKNFKHGMEEWDGQIEQHISVTNYGLLIWDLIDRRPNVVLATDLDGDRLTAPRVSRVSGSSAEIGGIPGISDGSMCQTLSVLSPMTRCS